MASEGSEGVVGSPTPAQRKPWRRARLVGRVVTWATVCGVAGMVVWWSVLSGVASSRREACKQQLSELGMALFHYQEAHGAFPAPAVRGKDGRPLLSWRVEILPQLGRQSLYDRFHRDEPWNSPHNVKLLKEMPAVFACPSGGWHAAGRTGYRVIVGPKSELGSVNTPFEPGRGADIREITDGTSITILVAESAEAVPWTKPDEFHYLPTGPLPRFGSSHAGGFNVVMANGLARFIKSRIDEMILRAVLTRNGGEITSTA